jgi:hypothetical protein
MYGAALATLVFAWNVYQNWSDRGKLRVECGIARAIPGGFARLDESESIKSGDCLYWVVTNVGRRPIMLRTLGGIYNGKREEGFTVPLEHGAKLLAPGESVSQYTHDLNDLAKVESLVAVDALGKFYYATRGHVRSIRKKLGVAG